MRVTIIRDDNAVTVDGVRFEIGAVSLLPADVHAVQWDGTRGEIEFRYSQCAHCGVGSKKPNEAISELKVGDTPLKPLLDAHATAKAAAEEAAKTAAEEAAKVAEQANASA